MLQCSVALIYFSMLANFCEWMQHAYRAALVEMRCLQLTFA